MKPLKIYNTLTRKKETFQPLMDLGLAKFVSIYSCGPTVYSTPHLGNLRAYVFADLLRNVLHNVLGYPVKYIVNITDVGHLTDDASSGDDKMEKAAKIQKRSAKQIARQYEKEFKEFLKMLNIDFFDKFPRATEHIKEQIELVKLLEQKGYTYTTSDGVYMDTSKVKDYGQLAKLDTEGLKAGARVELGEKRNPTDFALWKFSPKGEQRQMERDSPWGVGFPGWHVECSAMSRKYLGDQFDIHTGGVDHIPVHHTNEIAQSECALGVKPWVRYWMHNQFLQFKGEKASKSTGNVVYLQDLLDQGLSPLDFRYMCLNAHYRSFIDFTLENLQSLSKARRNLITRLAGPLYGYNKKGLAKHILAKNYQKFQAKHLNTAEGKKIFESIISALLDDLNTSKVLDIISKMSNNIIHAKYKSDEEVDDMCKIVFWTDDNVLKLEILKSVKEEIQKRQADTKIPKQIQEMAKSRWQAKLEKNFRYADELRDQIAKKGYIVEDVKNGTYRLSKK